MTENGPVVNGVMNFYLQKKLPYRIAAVTFGLAVYQSGLKSDNYLLCAS